MFKFRRISFVTIERNKNYNKYIYVKGELNVSVIHTYIYCILCINNKRKRKTKEEKKYIEYNQAVSDKTRELILMMM